MEQATQPIRVRPSTHARILRIKDEQGGTVDSVITTALDLLDARKAEK